MKHLLTSTAIAGALVLAGCGGLIPLHSAGTVVNEDGSHTTLLIGGDKGDPTGCNQAMALGAANSHYVRVVGGWRWTTDPVQLRPVEAAALGCTLAPALIEAGGTLGAGALVRSGEIGAGQAIASSNYAAAGLNAKALVKGDQAIGQGIAAQQPANINVQGSTASAAATATGGAGGVGGAGGSASAVGGAVTNTFNPSNTNTQFQQQQQQQQIRPFSSLPPS